MPKGKSAVIHRWTQEEMAAQIGTMREVVAWTLRAFADAGLLRIERHRIVLLDQAGLEAEARKQGGEKGGDGLRPLPLSSASHPTGCTYSSSSIRIKSPCQV